MNARSYDIRAASEPLTLTGTAIVFNEPAAIGNTTEIISDSALDGVDLSDVVLLTNHDGAQIPLARSPKTLTLEVTEKGLEMSATLPDTEQGRAVHEAVKRGDLSQMSFAFDIGDSDFDEQTQTRTIKSISRVYEISIVNYAAYKQTTVQARAGKEQTMTFNPITASLDAQAQARDITATPEYRSGFFKSLLGQELTDPESRAMTAARAEKRAESFNTLSNSAAVVPEHTLNEILSQGHGNNGLFHQVRLFNVPANLSISIGTPTDPAQWHVEGAAVDRNNIATTAVTFSAFELIKVLSMSAAARRMTVSAFENFVTAELKASVVDAIGQAIVNGIGAGQPQGLLSGINWTAQNSITTATITGDNLLQAIAKLNPTYTGGAKFAMSTATLFSNIYPLKDTQGAYIFTDTERGGQHRLFGFEIVLDDNLPVGVILFGNFRYFGINIPQGVAVEVSRDSGFTSGLIDYRALCIADGKPIVPGAFVKIEVQ
jgi:HK97 family phage major capsid protein